jgi:hypothetical protein
MVPRKENLKTSRNTCRQVFCAYFHLSVYIHLRFMKFNILVNFVKMRLVCQASV